MATRTYIGKGTDPSVSGTTKSYAGQGIGSAAADRTVVVVVNGTTIGATQPSFAATLGGNSMALEILVNGPPDGLGLGSSSFVAIFSLAVAAGTTATIALTAGSSCYDINIMVYAVYGDISGTKVTNSGNLGDDGTITLNANTTNGGIVIAGSNGYKYTGPASVSDAVYTGVTRDDSFANYTNNLCDSASLEASSTQTPRSISLAVTMETGTGHSICAAVISFSPGATINSGALSVTGTGTATFIGNELGSGVLAVTNVGALTGIGASIFSSVLAATSVGVLTGIGAATFSAVLSVTNTGVATFIGNGLASGILSSNAVNVSTFIGSSVATSGAFSVTCTSEVLFAGSYSGSLITDTDTGETSNDEHFENYIRRYTNDRDSLSVIENINTESASVGETTDDGHTESYMRRYLNDNV